MRPRLGLISILLAAGSLVFVGAATDLAFSQQSAADAASPTVQLDEQAQETQPAIPYRNLFDVVRDGGLLMIPILLCSVVLTVFLFERTVSLRRGRVIPGPFLKRFLHQLRDGQLSRDEALQLCRDNRSAVSDVISAALRKWGRPAVEVEQAMLDAGERVANQLRKYLRVFNGIATITPLLGLLGTVVGMIRAFNMVAQADALGRPELLAAGISQALLTTAGGLLVAIPALILYLFFTSRVDRLVMDLDAVGQDVVEMISDEPPTAAATTRKSRSGKQAA